MRRNSVEQVSLIRAHVLMVDRLSEPIYAMTAIDQIVRTLQDLGEMRARWYANLIGSETDWAGGRICCGQPLD